MMKILNDVGIKNRSRPKRYLNFVRETFVVQKDWLQSCEWISYVNTKPIVAELEGRLQKQRRLIRAKNPNSRLGVVVIEKIVSAYFDEAINNIGRETGSVWVLFGYSDSHAQVGF